MLESQLSPAKARQKGNLLRWLWSHIQKLPLHLRCPVPSPFTLWTLLIPAPREDVSIHQHWDDSEAGSPDVGFSSWTSGLKTGMFWGPEVIGHSQ